jgi:hypothetical protein
MNIAPFNILIIYDFVESTVGFLFFYLKTEYYMKLE